MIKKESATNWLNQDLVFQQGMNYLDFWTHGEKNLSREI